MERKKDLIKNMLDDMLRQYNFLVTENGILQNRLRMITNSRDNFKKWYFELQEQLEKKESENNDLST